MKFIDGDKWFKGLSKLYKVILMIIPLVNYVIEIYTRICAFIRKNSTLNLLGIVLFVVPWGLFISYIDFIWILIFDEQILIDK